MLGGPCDELALDVGSRLTTRLQARYGEPCRVTVAWGGALQWDSYRYRVEYGPWRAVQYITAALLKHAIGLDLVVDELLQRVATEAA